MKTKTITFFIAALLMINSYGAKAATRAASSSSSESLSKQVTIVKMTKTFNDNEGHTYLNLETKDKSLLQFECGRYASAIYYRDVIYSWNADSDFDSILTASQANAVCSAIVSKIIFSNEYITKENPLTITLKLVNEANWVGEIQYPVIPNIN